MIVVLDTFCKPIDFGFKRLGLGFGLAMGMGYGLGLWLRLMLGIRRWFVSRECLYLVVRNYYECVDVLYECLLWGAAMVQWLRRRTCTQRTLVPLLLVPILVIGSLVAAGRASGQNCSHAPVKVLPTMLGMAEPLNEVVIDVKYRRNCDV